MANGTEQEPSRGELALAARKHGRRVRAGWAAGIAAALTAAALFVVPNLDNGDASPSAARAAASTTTVKPLPSECADALALADKLIGPGGRLAKNARAHAAVMDLLEEGEINGHQAYEMGKKQVDSMLHDSPDVAAFIGRYQEVRKSCPLH